jgi:hypothetical protein
MLSTTVRKNWPSFCLENANVTPTLTPSTCFAFLKARTASSPATWSRTSSNVRCPCKLFREASAIATDREIEVLTAPSCCLTDDRVVVDDFALLLIDILLVANSGSRLASKSSVDDYVMLLPASSHVMIEICKKTWFASRRY